MADRLNRPSAFFSSKRAVKNGEVLWRDCRTLDGVIVLDELNDLLSLCIRVAEHTQSLSHRLVRDLEHSAADESLVLDESDIRLNARRVAVHHEANRAGRGKDRRLAVAITVSESNHVGHVPLPESCALDLVLPDQLVTCLIVLLNHRKERLTILGKPSTRTTASSGDLCAHVVGSAGHQRCDSRRVVAPLVRVVRDAPAHQQRSEIGVTQPEGAETMTVLLDTLRRVA